MAKSFIRDVILEEGDSLEKEIEILKIKGGLAVLSFVAPDGRSITGVEVNLQKNNSAPKETDVSKFSENMVLFDSDQLETNKSNSLLAFLSPDHANIENQTDPFEQLELQKQFCSGKH